MYIKCLMCTGVKPDALTKTETTPPITFCGKFIDNFLNILGNFRLLNFLLE